MCLAPCDTKVGQYQNDVFPSERSITYGPLRVIRLLPSEMQAALSPKPSHRAPSYVVTLQTPVPSSPHRVPSRRILAVIGSNVCGGACSRRLRPTTCRTTLRHVSDWGSNPMLSMRGSGHDMSGCYRARSPFLASLAGCPASC